MDYTRFSINMNVVFAKKSLFLAFFWVFLSTNVFGQIKNDTLAFLEIPSSINKTRLKTSIISTSAFYAGFSYGLYTAWYKNFPQESFHLFNDYGEWQNMDKYGHVFSAYFQADWMYHYAKWTGIDDDKAIWTGIIGSTLIQSTIEVFDGFSSNWGFSLTDVAANTIGVTAFGLQQKHWGEQRINFKLSSWPKKYDTSQFSSIDGRQFSDLQSRSNELFGSGFSERFLKDYNAQTYWASVNIHSFLPEGNKWPIWLNVALGYSAENAFGGFENVWYVDGSRFELGPDQDRYVQFVLTPDIDLTKIKTNSRFLKMLFGVLNAYKLPTPGLSINTRGEFNLHFVYLN